VIAQALITADVVEGSVCPWWLTERDHPWLQALLDRRRALEGRARADWQTVLRGAIHPSAHPRKQALAAEVLRRQSPLARLATPVHPREIRADLFRRAALGDRTREACIRQTARDLGLAPESVELLLFQDFASQRPLPAVPEDLGPARLALAANLALAQGLVARASTVTLQLRGGAHRVVRAARLRGLICEVEGQSGSDGARLRLSGPLVIFHRTRVYGRALASLVPLLRGCDEHRLEAHCAWRGHEGSLRLDDSSPLPAAPARRPFDSKLEARFARDFARHAPDWELVRDPAPLRAGQGLVFPDFGLRHRAEPARRALLEIVGFWTPDYLARKLARYRLARASDLILAIDARHAPDPAELPADARVVTFRSRLDPAAVLAILEGGAGEGPPPATQCTAAP